MQPSGSVATYLFLVPSSKCHRMNINKGTSGGPSSAFRGVLSLADLPTHLPNTSPAVSGPVELQPEKTAALPEPETNGVSSGQDKNSDINSIGTVADEVRAPITVDVPEETEKPKEKIYVPGTSISLDTEEDIQKWIEERKRKWPTRKNIEEKEKAQKETAVNQQKPGSGDNSGKRSRENNGDGLDNKRPKRICHFFQQNKKCRFGTKCKNIHEKGGSAVSLTPGEGAGKGRINSGSVLPPSSSSIVKTINGIQVNIPQRFKSEFYNKDPNSGTFFKMLVQKEHYQSNNELILQFLEYLDKKKLIDHNVSFGQ